MRFSTGIFARYRDKPLSEDRGTEVPKTELEEDTETTETVDMPEYDDRDKSLSSRNNQGVGSIVAREREMYGGIDDEYNDKDYTTLSLEQLEQMNQERYERFGSPQTLDIESLTPVDKLLAAVNRTGGHLAPEIVEELGGNRRFAPYSAASS